MKSGWIDTASNAQKLPAIESQPQLHQKEQGKQTAQEKWLLRQQSRPLLLACYHLEFQNIWSGRNQLYKWQMIQQWLWQIVTPEACCQAQLLRPSQHLPNITSIRDLIWQYFIMWLQNPQFYPMKLTTHITHYTTFALFNH